MFHDQTMERLFGPRFRGKRILDFNYAAIPLMDPQMAANHGHGVASNQQQRLASSSSSHPEGSYVRQDDGRSFNANPLHSAPRNGPAGASSGGGVIVGQKLSEVTQPEPNITPVVSQSAVPQGFDNPDSPAASTLPPGMTKLDYQVPLLEHIMSQCPGFPIQIDVKVNSPGLVEAVNTLVQKYNLQDKVGNAHCSARVNRNRNSVMMLNMSSSVLIAVDSCVKARLC